MIKTLSMIENILVLQAVVNLLVQGRQKHLAGTFGQSFGLRMVCTGQAVAAVQQVSILAHHLQSNGLTEGSNEMLLAALRKMISDQHTEDPGIRSATISSG